MVIAITFTPLRHKRYIQFLTSAPNFEGHLTPLAWHFPAPGICIRLRWQTKLCIVLFAKFHLSYIIITRRLSVGACLHASSPDPPHLNYVDHRRRRRGGSRGDRPPPQVSGRGGGSIFPPPQVLSLKNTNKEALSTPQPLSSNYHE